MIARITRVFLDCEWADHKLVSIGLVPQDGVRYFYAEREDLPDPTPWVEMVVFPRLERGEHVMQDLEMSLALWRYLKTFSAPRICYDAVQDKDLCIELLSWSCPDQEAIAEISWELLIDTGPALVRWWAEHPDEKGQQHHALADAKALRGAWLSLWGI